MKVSQPLDQTFKLIDAFKLLGVETILTGVRPEVTQTMIGLGIDISEIKVKTNVERAMIEFLI